MNFNIFLTPITVFKILIYNILILLCFNLIYVIGYMQLGYHGVIIAISQYFYLDGEANIPTLYSSILLLTSSFLLFFISKATNTKKYEMFSWIGLSLIFSFLAIDEFAMIHEGAGELFAVYFNTDQIDNIVPFSLGWTLPVSIILIFLTFIYWSFIFNLPKKTRFLFCLSAIIFVSGAIGFEIIGLNIESDVISNVPYVLFLLIEIINIEELFEMIGVSLFIFSLLDYLNFKNENYTTKIINKLPYTFFK